MNLSAPTQVIFIISLILAVCAIIGNFAPQLPFIGVYEFWVAIAGYVVLAAGCLMKGGVWKATCSFRGQARSDGNGTKNPFGSRISIGTYGRF